MYGGQFFQVDLDLFGRGRLALATVSAQTMAMASPY